MNKNRILASGKIGNTNRKHKDRLFRLIFSERKDLLTLYNAISGTNYTNEDDLEINTIEDVIYMSLKNDLSFIIGDSLNLYEHQSSSCGNLPLRGLFYLASIYRKYVKQKRDNIYGSSTIPLPLPQYCILQRNQRRIRPLGGTFIRQFFNSEPLHRI